MVKVFESEYPKPPLKLSTHDHDTVAFVVKTILPSYLKPPICTHFRKLLEQELHTVALATVVTKMEHAKATAALSATETVLQKQATSLLQNAKTLQDVVTLAVDKRQHQGAPNKRTRHTSNDGQHNPNNKRVKFTPNHKASGERPPHSGQNTTGNRHKQSGSNKQPHKPTGPRSTHTGSRKSTPNVAGSKAKHQPSLLPPTDRSTNRKETHRTQFRAKNKEQNKKNNNKK
jgi:hypothetical protein